MNLAVGVLCTLLGILALLGSNYMVVRGQRAGELLLGIVGMVVSAVWLIMSLLVAYGGLR